MIHSIRAAYWLREYEYHPLRHKRESLGSRQEWQTRLRRAGEAADRLLGERLGWIWPDDELKDRPSTEMGEKDVDEKDSAECESAGSDTSRGQHDERKNDNSKEEMVFENVKQAYGQGGCGGEEERPARRQRPGDAYVKSNGVEDVDLTREFIEAGLLSPYAESVEL